ncbi:MAG: dimethylargininase [Luteitalea sp.]|nr:dimethylargininase [Luteitalea sp.]
MLALTREVSPALARCQLTHVPRRVIDVDRARAQHAAYEDALRAMGCHVERLAAGDEMPDSVFIEDTALVLDEVAVIARPGAPSRRGEVQAIMLALQPYRPLIQIEPPGTLDGGDILVVARSIFVGVTAPARLRRRGPPAGRTNAEGVAQLRQAAGHFGYDVRAVAIRGCLHLKSAVTALDAETLLVQREWAPADDFRAFELVDVHSSEPAGANVVRVGARLLYADAFPRTRDRIASRGYDLSTVDVSELAKAEGALTCCSLIFGENVPGDRNLPG